MYVGIEPTFPVLDDRYPTKLDDYVVSIYKQTTVGFEPTRVIKPYVPTW